MATASNVTAPAPGNLNFKATFSEAITSFTISVDPEFIEFTKLKASLTRLVDADLSDQDAFADGPPRHDVETIRDFWANKYDWHKIEAELNQKFKQYTTVVQTGPDTNYTDPIPLHFVHHRSDRPDAIPLLFIHGWPGSFLEVENIIEPLVHPPDDSLPAFHVVAPSIPGFGFSPSPRKPGFGYRQSGHAFHELMQKLGYEKYVIQGGDAGDFILRYQAHDYPESVVSVLSNFWIIPPNEDDRERDRNNQTSDDENFIIELHDAFTTQHWAYGQIHQQKPLKLAIGMTDSPVGLAMWIYDAVVGVVVDKSIWTPERLITWTMMHWIPGPYAAFSLYKNGAKDGAINIHGFGKIPYVTQPVAISEFPKDIWYRTPLDWAQRGGNVQCRTVHETGGHFPSLDTPELLLKDMWKFFGDEKMSRTEIFKSERAGIVGDESCADELFDVPAHIQNDTE
ncbi:uncharacterized protein Z518_03381 [Rhinocladiella mackenziei CBS 650.93]|uniref:Epoxide hydrolase N-terminal domain-containing protein n=1 Tax=Rhinocladiella mackenziei CBS 650.93 TaxID=1442369 RepID=A0A0D2IRV3_9EURO|nr:uncharacterized protein Z518_03381 [Rhinocladiella mackenziei CBS 650.93]KIX08724.1 hypothetical protein Z518_03381 [Rhinocladiella mackenziei CBS 650.93]